MGDKMGVDFQRMEKNILWKSMGSINCLVNEILQNIYPFNLWIFL